MRRANWSAEPDASDTALRSIWTTVDGMKIHCRAAGAAPHDAPAVVLVHGLGISSSYMVPLLRRMAPYFRTYAPDLPGFGWSDKPKHVLSLEELADSLARWIEVMRLDRPVLLGNSYGCQFIIEMAVRHPESLGYAVLQGPTTDPRGRTVLRQVGRWILLGQMEPITMPLLTFRDYLLCGTRRLVKTFFEGLYDKPEKKLPHIQVPTLVVRGSRDVIVSQHWAEDVAELLPRGELVIIPGATHTINYAFPLELTRVTHGFLRRHGAIGQHRSATSTPRPAAVSRRPAARRTRRRSAAVP